MRNSIMKYLLLTGCILLCAFVIAQTKVSQEATKISGVDSFYFHYNILDSISKKNGRYNNSIACISAVAYLEKTTGIKAHPDGDYFGWKNFSSSDLIKWDKWHKTKYPRITYKKKEKK
jgi:hypothetical protein